MTDKYSAARAWQKANPEKKKAIDKAWWENNPGYSAERVRKWRKANPEKHKANRLRQKYGITIEQFNQMFDEQSGCCAICKKHQSLLKKTLCVDHNHDTGHIRGLLCDLCNTGLGKFKDDKAALAAAIEYLNKSNVQV